MSGQRTPANPLVRFIWRILSVPIFFKFLGIGALVATLFGTVILIHVRSSLYNVMYEQLEEYALSESRSLASALSRPLAAGDIVSADKLVQNTKIRHPDARYVIVRDAHGNILSHTFQKGVPPDLESLPASQPDENGIIRILDSQEGLIVDALCAIDRNSAETVQVGMSDVGVERQVEAVTRSVLWALAASIAIGFGLALGLTYVLTKPLYHLEQTTQRIRIGDFGARSTIYSMDEIGQLALAFNQMAASLETYRAQIEEKEKVRQQLTEKVIHTQEEERKLISRELHDQIGQSTLALLLSLQSNHQENRIEASVYRDLENRIRHLADEIHRLAWGLRPAILDDYGLHSALTRYFEEISRYGNTQIDFQFSRISGPERLSSTLEISLYRIAQAAVTNILQHARATQGSVVVLQRTEGIVLIVEDNGCGFNLDGLKQDNRLGILGIQERVLLLGGSCEVLSQPGKGTSIHVKLPLAARN